MTANRKLGWAMVASLLAAGVVAACGPTTSDSLLGAANGGGPGGSNWGPGGGGGPTYTGGNNGGGGGGVQAAIAEQLYRSVEPGLKMKCANGCHDTGVNAKDYKWLAGPDTYQTIKKYPGIIVDDVFSSKLENHPANHPTASLVGPGAAPDPMLLDGVTKWLTAEAAALQSMPLPSTDPVDVMSGSVDLTKAGVAGAKITFSAQDLGGGIMRFANVTLVAPGNTGIHVIAPLLVMVPGMGADVHDLSNSAIDAAVAAGATKVLDSVLYFYNWKAGSKVRVEFQKIESATVMGSDGGAMGGCKDVMTFQSSAAPQMQQCLGCHGGNNAQATNAVDMTGLVGNKNVASACAQARFRINFMNKAQSPILIDPRDKLNGHPFQVPAGNANAYTTGLTNWINKE